MPNVLLNLTEAGYRRSFTDADFERLRTAAEVRRFDPLRDPPDAFAHALAEADAMITGAGSRRLTEADWPVERRRPLLVAHAGGSIRGMVPRALLERGARVSQAASGLAVSVAHFAVGLILVALRQSVARSAAMRQGEAWGTVRRPEWNAFQNQDLEEVTVALVGLSQVGRRMPPLLAPFGCRITAYDPFWTREAAAALGVTLLDDLDALLAGADVVSLHLPQIPATANMIDARRVGLLKRGAVFVNTARPGPTDQEALLARAIAGEIQFYTDVTAPEPLPPDHPAWQSPHVFITPHLAGPTRQAVRRVGRFVIAEVERFLAGQPLQGEVPLDTYDRLA